MGPPFPNHFCDDLHRDAPDEAPFFRALVKWSSVRLGLIGDVHAEDALVVQTLEAFRHEQIDHVLCTGDIVDGPGDIERTRELLEKANALVVRGNHDRWIRDDDVRNLPHAHRMTDLSGDTTAFLQRLPPTLTLDIVFRGESGRLLLCHGVGKNDMNRLGPDDYGYAIATNDDLAQVLSDASIRFMVAGHTHRPMLRRFERRSGRHPLFVINAGTLARENEPGFVILDLAREQADFYRVSLEGSAHVSSERL
jgi:predicted phosphodiesterase